MAWTALAPIWDDKDVLCPAHIAPPMAIIPEVRMTGRRPTAIAKVKPKSAYVLDLKMDTSPVGINTKLLRPNTSTGTEAWQEVSHLHPVSIILVHEPASTRAKWVGRVAMLPASSKDHYLWEARVVE